MTKDQALYTFFSSFGVTAYPDTAVPEDAVMPYLTYSAAFDGWGNFVALTANLWYRTESEAIPTAKAQEICDRIGNGCYQTCDGGAILFTMGSPKFQNLTDAADSSVKRRYMNINAEYLTLN